MKKLNIKESFKNKRSRYGGYSAAITVIFIAIVIVINLIAGKLNWNVDLTQNKLFSLSPQTNNVLKSLKNNVNIYVLDQPGQEDQIVESILQRYAAGSNKITLSYKDPVKYPDFAKQYVTDGSQINPGSIVVVSGSKYKYIDASSLVNVNYDQTTGQPVSDSLAVEQMVTGALINVTSSSNPVIYTLQGHGEQTLPQAISNQLSAENYTVQSVDLLANAVTLNPANTLLVFSPQKDLTTSEADKIKSFLTSGGRALFLMDVAPDMPNFQSLLNYYGVNIKRSVIVDADSSHYQQSPVYILPDFGSQEIVTPLANNNLKVLLPGAQDLEILKSPRSTLQVTPLLTTSQDSWGKVNMQATTLSKEAGDLTGPFNVAAAITDTPTNTSAKPTKLVVVSNGAFATSQFIGTSGNLDFFMNSINWLQDNKTNISIVPKDLSTETITISTAQRLSITALVVVVIPAVIVVLGIVVVLRRKRL